MDFVIQWLWYLLAFVVGSLVAWLIAVSIIRTTAGRAISHRFPADESETR